MPNLLRYLGIAALGFFAVAAIGITLGASTMLACYLTTCGISRAQRAAVQEIKELEAQPQTPASERPEDEGRRTWARYEQTGEIVETAKLDAMLPPLPEEDGRTVTLKSKESAGLSGGEKELGR